MWSYWKMSCCRDWLNWEFRDPWAFWDLIISDCLLLWVLLLRRPRGRGTVRSSRSELCSIKKSHSPLDLYAAWLARGRFRSWHVYADSSFRLKPLVHVITRFAASDRAVAIRCLVPLHVTQCRFDDSQANAIYHTNSTYRPPRRVPDKSFGSGIEFDIICMEILSVMKLNLSCLWCAYVFESLRWYDALSTSCAKSWSGMSWSAASQELGSVASTPHATTPDFLILTLSKIIFALTNFRISYRSGLLMSVLFRYLSTTLAIRKNLFNISAENYVGIWIQGLKILLQSYNCQVPSAVVHTSGLREKSHLIPRTYNLP